MVLGVKSCQVRRKHMPRHQRILSKTGTYHVMMRGNEKKNLFLDEEDKQRFLETLFAKKIEAGFSLLAYCLMDNHVHLVIQEGEESLATIMKRINASYAYYFNQKYKRVGHLFQDRFKSETIDDERYLMAVTRYIHNNPVKAGIGEKPEDYKWSSYKCYLAPDKPESRNVNTDVILSSISLDQKQAINEFKRFSLQADTSEFMDINEDDSWTLEESKAYLEEYMKTEWPGYQLQELMKNKHTRNEIVQHIRQKTNLSIRKTADLLGITRGSIQYLK